MEDQNFQEMLLAEIALYFQPLRRIADEEDGIMLFFEELGWDLEGVFGPAAADFADIISGLGSTDETIEQLAEDASIESFEDFSGIVQTVPAEPLG